VFLGQNWTKFIVIYCVYYFWIIIIYHTTYGTNVIMLSLRKLKTPRSSSVCWRRPSQLIRLKSQSKRVIHLLLQLSSSRRMPKSPSSKSEEEDIFTPLRLTSRTSSRPLRVDLARKSKKLKSRREELLPRRPRNDQSLI